MDQVSSPTVPTPAPIMPSMPETQAPKKSKKLLFLIFGVIILAVVLIFGRSVLFKGFLVLEGITSPSQCRDIGGLWDSGNSQCIDPDSVNETECNALGGTWESGQCMSETRGPTTAMPSEPTPPDYTSYGNQNICLNNGGLWANDTCYDPAATEGACVDIGGRYDASTQSCITGTTVQVLSSVSGGYSFLVSPQLSCTQGFGGTYNEEGGTSTCTTSTGTQVWNGTSYEAVPGGEAPTVGDIVPAVSESEKACTDLDGVYTEGDPPTCVEPTRNATFVWNGTSYVFQTTSTTLPPTSTSTGTSTTTGGREPKPTEPTATTAPLGPAEECEKQGGTFTGGSRPVCSLAGTNYAWNGSIYVPSSGGAPWPSGVTSTSSPRDRDRSMAQTSTLTDEKKCRDLGNVWRDGRCLTPTENDLENRLSTLQNSLNVATTQGSSTTTLEAQVAQLQSQLANLQQQQGGGGGTTVIVQAPLVSCPSGFTFDSARNACIATEVTVGVEPTEVTEGVGIVEEEGVAALQAEGAPAISAEVGVAEARTPGTSTSAAAAAASPRGGSRLHGAYIQGQTGPGILLYPALLGAANALWYFRRKRMKNK